jgi:flagellar biogenesis protein FliO
MGAIASIIVGLVMLLLFLALCWNVERMRKDTAEVRSLLDTIASRLYLILVELRESQKHKE